MKMRFVSSSIMLLLHFVLVTEASAQRPAPPVDAPHEATPLAEVRRKAIDARSFQRPLTEDRIRKWLQLSSRTTMAEFDLFLAPLTPQESKLLAKMQPLQPPIVNRLSLANLRGVLKNGGLLSLAAEQKLQQKTVRHTTPGVEELLYDAYECVFASVGPPHGTARYGEVIIRLKDTVREHGWATPFSGMHFVGAIRHKNAQGMLDLLKAGQKLPTTPGSPLSLNFDDRLHFSHYIVSEKEWSTALAYQAILVLRNLDTSPADQQARARFEQMLDKNGTAFWELFIPPYIAGLPRAEEAARVPFGYLEGKFPDQVLIENFTSIEVPAERLEEIRAWPEAKPYLQLIKPKPPGIP
ncbi:MAG: hypothetical protein K8T91_05590 [Planctomycetes bacterium]|nr:hypothetical protein [Planctomycetota bacterium]